MKHALDEKYFVQSVKNALRVLKLFTPKTPQLSVTDISKTLNLPKSTTHRLIKELVVEGFLRQDEKNAKYMLGFSILGLGGVVRSHKEIYLEAQPLLAQLVDRFQLPVHICVMEQRNIVYLMREMGEIPMKLITKTGRRNDLHCTAEGLAILAFKSKPVIESVLMQPLKKYTQYTLTDADALKEEILNVHYKQFAITKNTYAIGYSSYAAPIQDYTGEVVSSLAIIAKNNYFQLHEEEDIIEAMKETAKEISELLGYYE
ncbi:IclR family transcriptional regulator [Savagea faecisuis]|uniref:IclR family transcriptional regulator n=1 Tax=Savagea faecisuis TaxID=1274803 RepID=A0ABW3GZC9_9BACL